MYVPQAARSEVDEPTRSTAQLSLTMGSLSILPSPM